MPFRLWLRRITYDRLLMVRRQHVRSERRTVERDVALPDRSSLLLAQQLLAGSSSPSEQLAKRELRRRVNKAVADLAETDREILLMRNFEGLSNQEVSQLLGISLTAASQRYGRALLRLRKILIDRGLPESEP
jgi:RNA polymerase sigma-70 factor (ECF subfamily)